MAKRSRTTSILRPQLFSLEERAVPASLYVDNAFIGKTNGAIVTFNQGQSNQQAGLVIGTNAFATFDAAITKANADAAADTINFANGNFNVDQAANSGAFLITNPLEFVGSGVSKTTFTSISDTADASGTNGALFAAQNTSFNVRDLTLTGGGPTILTASAFRYEDSTGTVTNVAVNNVSDLSQTTVSLGYAIVGTGSGTNITVSNSTFTNNGRGDVRLDAGAKGTITGNTFTGRTGTLANSINYGVDLTDGSSALISGNTFTGFLGTDGTLGSSAIQVTSSIPASPSSATLLGNTLDGNFTGIAIGLNGSDTSTVNAQFNNIINNTVVPGSPDSGISSNGVGVITAYNNYWGSTAGPLAVSNPTGTPTSGVSPTVLFRDALVTEPPQAIAQAPLRVAVTSTVAAAKIAASPSATITGPAIPTDAPITLTVTFNDVVTGFTQSDIVLGGTAGTGTITGFTTTDNKTFTVTVAGLNKRGTLTANIAASQALNLAGLGNNPSTNNIAFQPIFDRGFAVSGDSGITTPVYGVTDTYTTRFGESVFGANYTGGQRVATADLNGDGTLDYIVGSGPGITTQVLAFDGLTGKQIFSITPFGNFSRGATVSAGDLTGDGLAEIAITSDPGGGARVRIFSPNAQGVFTQLSDFIALIGSDGKADVKFRGGARSAIGDINGDGRKDFIFAAGTGGGPRIAIFNGLTLGLNGGPKLTGDFFVFENTIRTGTWLDAGDVNGDGKADLIVGPGNGASRVRVIDGNTLFNSGGTTVTAFADFYAYGTKGGTGVHVAATDIDGDGKADIVTGPGVNAGSTVKVYSATNILANGSNPTVTKTLDLFGSFNGGLFVG